MKIRKNKWEIILIGRANTIVVGGPFWTRTKAQRMADSLPIIIEGVYHAVRRVSE